MKFPINAAGIALLEESEDFVGIAYPDPCSPLGRALQKAGLWRKTLKGAPIPDGVRYVKGKELSGKPWTIGLGFTEGVKEGDTMTRPQADARLARELQGYVAAVQAACTIEPNENQLAGLTVCAWNIGKSAIASSSMVKAHNRGDFAAAARAFALWNKSAGQVVQALVTRRAHEAALYLKPVPGAAPLPEDDEVAPEPMPQAVQPESSLLRSPIVQGTAATAGTGITALADLADKASTAQSSVSVLSRLLGPVAPYWPYIAMAAIVIVAGAVIFHRWKQRQGGWA